ncbi:MAG: 6-phospho-beta-glucosidase [Paludibacteraceae bacterium]|nr:6-phospho-beta-glucosidase [Paludibacteraceae bacterium]
MKMFTTPKNKIESLNEFSYWTFIEENLHNYYSDDRVLKSDILLRYLDGETIETEDLEWIKANYGSKSDVLSDLQNIEQQLFAESLDNFYKMRFAI